MFSRKLIFNTCFPIFTFTYHSSRQPIIFVCNDILHSHARTLLAMWMPYFENFNNFLKCALVYIVGIKYTHIRGLCWCQNTWLRFLYFIETKPSRKPLKQLSPEFPYILLITLMYFLVKSWKMIH